VNTGIVLHVLHIHTYDIIYHVRQWQVAAATADINREWRGKWCTGLEWPNPGIAAWIKCLLQHDARHNLQWWRRFITPNLAAAIAFFFFFSARKCSFDLSAVSRGDDDDELTCARGDKPPLLIAIAMGDEDAVPPYNIAAVVVEPEVMAAVNAADVEPFNVDRRGTSYGHMIQVSFSSNGYLASYMKEHKESVRRIWWW
jgi:hypothetical protein